MENKEKTRTEQILKVMQVLAWIAFVGYSIEAGAFLVSFVVSWFNPEAVENLYKGQNFSALRELNFGYYAGAISFVVLIFAMKAYTWYIVIQTLSKINLANPFTMEVALMLTKISYVLFGTWVVGTVSSGYSTWLVKNTGEIFETSVSGEFIFMAGLVFIISQVFKRGIEIQSDNELTV